jgi:hypothetical protein
VGTGLIIVIKGMLWDHAMNRILPILLVTDLIKERFKPALFVLIRGNNFHNKLEVDLPDMPEISLFLNDSATNNIVAELQSFLFGFEGLTIGKTFIIHNR